MTLSVIIPVYNVAPYLRRCVESVLRQTYRDMEIILVDDGSTDESSAICDEYAGIKGERISGLTDERIRVIHKPNGGLSDARNAGLKVAAGEYVVFLDSDDEWLIETGIEQMMSRLEQEQTETDMLLFKNVDIYPNRREYARDYDTDYIRSHTAQEVFERLILTERFCMSACFRIIRRKVLVENNITFPIGYISEDVDFSCRLWQKAQSVDVLNLDMYGYHHRTNSISTSYSIRVLLSYDKMFTHWKQEIAEQCVNYVAIGAFMANLFVSCCYNYFSIARADRSRAMHILLEHQDLLQYAASKKSLRMRKVVDAMGVHVGIYTFATYGWLKKLYIAKSLKKS